MDEQKKLEQEKAELNALINRGVTFEVDDFEVKIQKVLFGLLKRRMSVPVKRTFKIEEPTLDTLDRLSAEWIDLAIDENAIKNEDGMHQAKILAHNHSKRCAKIIAIATLGSNYLIPKAGRNGTVQYVEDSAELNRLTELFARAIKPSVLCQLSVLVNAMSNLGDFVHSIRLMSGDRSTMPIRVEENSED